jgi:hypothetical protein
MKLIFAPLLGLMVSVAAVATAQDKEALDQIKEANEAAKRLGITPPPAQPDINKLMEESAKEDAADEAAAKATSTATPPAQQSASTAPRINVDLPVGAAKGSITYENATAELKFAGAFTDQKDDRKPVVLVVSDQKLPIEKWSSEFDMMRDNTKWSGLVFFLDKEGTAYRTDVHTKGRQASVSGIFDLKINDPASKDLAGMAKTESASADTKLNVTFHAAVK